MSFKSLTDSRLSCLESKTRGLEYYRASTSELDNLRKSLEKRIEILEAKTKHAVSCLEFQVSRHDELQEQFDMLMDHLGLRIENGPRIVKDK